MEFKLKKCRVGNKKKHMDALMELQTMSRNNKKDSDEGNLRMVIQDTRETLIAFSVPHTKC